MTPDERVDAALEAVLKAMGTSLKYYSLQSKKDGMREAMRKIMSESYIQGSNDCADVLKGKRL